MLEGKGKNIILWLGYGIMALIALLVQTGFINHFPIYGAKANIIPVCVAVVAIYEGHMSGAVFGMVCGVFLDGVGSSPVWLYTVVLAAGGYVIGLLASYTARGALFSCLVWSLALLVVIGLGQLFFYGVLSGHVETAAKVAGAQTLYSLAFVIPLRYAAGWIHKKGEKNRRSI